MKPRIVAGLVLTGLVPLGAVTACSGPPAPPPPPPQPSHVQVVAHPDDDILFMNPDLAAGIRRGEPTASIYLTGGESSLPDPQRYITQRQDGTRAAFARMAGAPDQWQRTTVPAGNHHVEVDHLAAQPQVRLVFLNLPEDADPNAVGGQHALIRMREQDAAVRTVLSEAGTVRGPETYRRGDVESTLAALYQRFRPTTIGLQDPAPDPRFRNEWVGFHNHPDHVVGAQFARAAADEHVRRTGRHVDVVHYRDYNVADSPVNLAPADRAAKHDEFGVYTRHDAEADTGGAYADWIARSRYRWPRGSQWAGRDGRGALHAFAVRGSEIAHWQRDGHRWAPAQWEPAPGPVRPVLRVVDQGGRLALVAQSLDGRHVLLRRQGADGSWSPHWQDLGAPGQAAAGAPAAVVDSGGRLVVLARNQHGGVSALRETGPGVFGAWQDLGGSDVRGSPSAAVGPGGRLDVVAATGRSVVRWHESDPGTLPASPEPLLNVAAAEPPTVRGAPGGMRLLVKPAGGERVAMYEYGPDGQVRAPQHLPNPGGMEQPAMARGVAFARDGAGHVHACSPDGTWTDLGGPVRSTPTVVAGPDGRLTLVAAAPNGQLLHNEQRGPGQGFGGWKPAAARPAPESSHRAEGQ